MTELEKNIINLLPTLSAKAKNEARLILGVNFSTKKKKQIITNDQARANIRKILKI